MLQKFWNCFKDNPNLAELSFVWYILKSKASIGATTSRLLQDCDPMLPTKIIFLLTRITLFCHASSDTIYSKDKNFGFYNSFPTFLQLLTTSAVCKKIYKQKGKKNTFCVIWKPIVVFHSFLHYKTHFSFDGSRSFHVPAKLPQLSLIISSKFCPSKKKILWLW